MKVVIAGGGNVGTFIAQELARSGHEITIVDLLERINGHVPEPSPVAWLVGDACEPSVLASAGADRADVVVAATGDDEDNLVVSLLAKQEYAVPKVVARVNHPKNEWMFDETWGVDVSVSTPHLLTALVEEALSVGSLVKLLRLERGDAALNEITLAENSPAVGRSLADLDLTRDATIVAVVRGGHVVVPRGDTVLAAGDEVLVLVVGGADEAVVSALAGQSNS